MRLNYSIRFLGGGFSIPAQKQIEILEKKGYLNQVITQDIFKKELSDEMFDTFASRILEEGDLLHCWGNMSLYTLQKAKQMKIKTILERGNCHIQEQARILKEEGSIIPEKTIERQSREYELADYILVDSNYIKDSFEKYGLGHKVKVLPLGVDTKKFIPSFKEKSDKFIVLTIMSNPIRKGLKYLYQAFKELNLKNAELRIISCNGVNEKNIKFLGYVDDLVKEYQQASVFILPSIEDGFGLVVLEAMACGLPVIVSENVGAKEILTKGFWSGGKFIKEGNIIPIRNIEAIKKDLLFYYENREMCLTDGKEARKTAEKWSWDKYKKSYIEIIESIC